MHLMAETLTCVRGTRTLFEGLSFTVQAGQALVVTGPNGAGKSSLLRLLAGLSTPRAGAVRLEGGEAGVPLAEQAHYLGHLDAHKATLTAAENLGFWRAAMGGEAASVAQAMQAVGISPLARLPVGVLSAGQKRRLALARLLVVRRPVWLLDEPTAALDVAGQDCLAGLVRSHLTAGGLVVAATHAPLDFGPARELALGRAAPARAA